MVCSQTVTGATLLTSKNIVSEALTYICILFRETCIDVKKLKKVTFGTKIFTYIIELLQFVLKL